MRYSLCPKKNNLVGNLTSLSITNLDMRLSRFIVLDEVKSSSRLLFFKDGGSTLPLFFNR